MNEPSTSSFFMVLLFILRCFIPLAILFGISYLLRRMGLVAVETPEPKEPEDLAENVPSRKPVKRTQKIKSAPPGKKAGGTKTKAKTGNSRSRSK